MPPEQELEGLPGTQLGGQLGDAAQQGRGGQQLGLAGAVQGGRGVHRRGGGRGDERRVGRRRIGHHRGGRNRIGRRRIGRRRIGRRRGGRRGGGRRGRAAGRHRRGGVLGGGRPGPEAGCEHLVQGAGQQRGEPLVGAGAQLQPAGGAVVDEQQQAPGVRQRGDRSAGVADELLPDAFPQGHLGELAVVAQPGLHLGQGEGRAGLGAADRLREVRVPAAPVAHRRTADPGEPGDARRGHLRRGVPRPPVPRPLVPLVPLLPHPRRSPRPVCGDEHTGDLAIPSFTCVHSPLPVNRVDSVHMLCSY